MKITCLADVEQFEAVPPQDRWRGRNTYDLLARSAARYADRPAFKFQYTSAVDEEPHTVSYEELFKRVTQTANMLSASGVDIGAVTSILLPNLPENHYTIWGAQALGIASPINYMLEPIAFRDILRESEARALVCLGPSSEFDIWEKTLQIVDELPDLQVVFAVASAPDALPDATPGGIPIRPFSTALEAQPTDRLVFDREIDIEEVGIYFHTGGTTGTPKLARISHRNQVHVASFKADFSRLNEESVGICALPLFHVNAVYNTGLNFFAVGGHPVYLTAKGFRTKGLLDNFWKLVERYQGSMFNTVPTVVSALLGKSLDGIDISSLKYVICGAAPISPEVFRRFQETTGANILEGYGLTEGTLSSSANPMDGEKRLGSVGIRSPYQQMKCVILGADGNYERDCDFDEVGVIAIKGPNVFMGYKQEPANDGLFVDGWFLTGDLARQDSDGYFWMTGRAKDLIIRGGNNIDPKGIEDVLTEHPAVELAAAVGQPDSYAGELPCAFVSLDEDFKLAADDASLAALAEELQSFAKERVSERAAAPVHVAILDEMPITAVGKIFKPSLVAMAIERVLSEALRPLESDLSLSVVNDKRLGMLATVGNVGDSEADRERVRAVLDQFTVKYELAA
ncbi:MAG: acyl-CoA synthetase [Pseudomonadota bacterium]